MAKILATLLNWCFSFLDTIYGKTTKAVEKVASKKQADYRTLMAKEGVPPRRPARSS